MHVSKGRSGVSSYTVVAQPTGRRGPKPKPVVEHPEPLTDDWVDPPSFAAALALHIGRHGDSYHHLHRAIIREGERFDRKTLQFWATGTKRPQSVVSFDVLARIEHRYRLPSGYFRTKLEQSGRAPLGHDLPDVIPSERRRMAWHLYSATIWMRGRIASPKLLPMVGSLPHLKCSRDWSGASDESGEHGDADGVGGSDRRAVSIG